MKYGLSIYNVFIHHGVEKSMKYEKKMPGFGTHIPWLGILQGSQYAHNMKIWSMCILERNFDFSNLYTEKCQKNANLQVFNTLMAINSPFFDRFKKTSNDSEQGE